MLKSASIIGLQPNPTKCHKKTTQVIPVHPVDSYSSAELASAPACSTQTVCPASSA